MTLLEYLLWEIHLGEVFPMDAIKAIITALDDEPANAIATLIANPTKF